MKTIARNLGLITITLGALVTPACKNRPSESEVQDKEALRSKMARQVQQDKEVNEYLFQRTGMKIAYVTARSDLRFTLNQIKTIVSGMEKLQSPKPLVKLEGNLELKVLGETSPRETSIFVSDFSSVLEIDDKQAKNIQEFSLPGQMHTLYQLHSSNLELSKLVSQWKGAVAHNMLGESGYNDSGALTNSFLIINECIRRAIKVLENKEVALALNDAVKQNPDDLSKSTPLLFSYLGEAARVKNDGPVILMTGSEAKRIYADYDYLKIIDRDPDDFNEVIVVDVTYSAEKIIKTLKTL